MQAHHREDGTYPVPMSTTHAGRPEAMVDVCFAAVLGWRRGVEEEEYEILLERICGGDSKIHHVSSDRLNTWCHERKEHDMTTKAVCTQDRTVPRDGALVMRGW